MTVAALASSIEYAENGVTLTFALPFRFGANSIVATRRLASGVTVPLAAGVAFTTTGGDTDAGGSATLIGTVAGAFVRFDRVTARSQSTDYTTNDRFPAEAHEGALDRAMLIDQEQDTRTTALAARAILVPDGQTAPAFGGKVADYANKLIGFNADATATVAVTPGGADSALRTDLALIGGQLTRTRYGLLDGVLTSQFRSDADWLVNWPPFATAPMGDLIPTPIVPLAAARYGANDEYLLIRVLSESLAGTGFDEWVLRDPRGLAGVDGGWEEVSHRALVRGVMKKWFQSTGYAGANPNPEFALRMGQMAKPYESGGDDPAVNWWRYRGFGHGGMTNIPANNTISLNGGGTNYQNIANWPANRRLYGSTLQIQCLFTIKVASALTAPGAALSETNAATLTYAQSFGISVSGKKRGLVRYGALQTTGAGYGWQDSYGIMRPVSPYAEASHVKLSGLPAELIEAPVVAFDKPLAYPNPWHTATPSQYQIYNEYQSDIAAVSELSYDGGGGLTQLLRKQGGGGPGPWGQCAYARAILGCRTDFPKLYVHLVSATEGPPKTAITLNPADVWEWQYYCDTRVGALI